MALTEIKYSFMGVRAMLPETFEAHPLLPTISVSGSNFNPQNTQCIPAVKIFAFLALEQD